MMGPRQIDRASLVSEFSLERYVPSAHLLRAIDRFVDFVRRSQSLSAVFYSSTGRPLIGNCWSGFCWLATATAFVRTAGCARKFT